MENLTLNALKSKYKLIFLTILSFNLSSFSPKTFATNIEGDVAYKPFYIGGIGGIGTTTWYGLVPNINVQNDALSLSTPINAKEGGPVWGVFAGWEPIPFFAFEFNYMHYPHAEVIFDKESLFAFDHNGQTMLNTRAETYNVMGKIMFFIPYTKVRLYSAAGVGKIHRHDILMNHWRHTPTFSAGLNYNFTARIFGEIGGNYTAGYGESQLNPANSYFPFLYCAYIRFALRII